MASYYVAARNGESIEGKTIHADRECDELRESDGPARPLAESSVESRDLEASHCEDCTPLDDAPSDAGGEAGGSSADATSTGDDNDSDEEGESEGEMVDGAAVEVEDEGYDPIEDTVDGVREWARDTEDVEALEAALDAEREGPARSTAIDVLESRVNAVTPDEEESDD